MSVMGTWDGRGPTGAEETGLEASPPPPQTLTYCVRSSVTLPIPTPSNPTLPERALEPSGDSVLAPASPATINPWTRGAVMELRVRKGFLQELGGNQTQVGACPWADGGRR